MGNESELSEIKKKLDALMDEHSRMSKDLSHLYTMVLQFQKRQFQSPTWSSSPKTIDKPQIVKESAPETHTEETPITARVETEPTKQVFTPPHNQFHGFSPTKNHDNYVEQLIGVNLGSKIGILVILVGIIIGAKYSIENNLITPIMRIILGYITGIGLLITAVRKESTYRNFSAVVMSGAISVFYFNTYAAYVLYDLLPRPVAFGLMVLFTIFAIAAALRYDRQIIAHFGLVASYAVPFLLSDNSKHFELLFSYILIINIGIVLIGIRKKWWQVFVNAFVFTWLIYGSWIQIEYAAHPAPLLGGIFLLLYFLLFTFVSMKSAEGETEYHGSVAGILQFFNAIALFGYGYYMLEQQAGSAVFEGLFAFSIAVFHMVLGTYLQKKLNASIKFGQVFIAISLLFALVCIPVQFDGRWVTVISALAAGLLWLLAYRQKQMLYAAFSIGALLFSVLSFMEDFENYLYSYGNTSGYMHDIPFFNLMFLTGIVLSAAFGYVFLTFDKSKLFLPEKYWKTVTTVRKSLLGGFIGFTYLSVFCQICMLFDHEYFRSVNGEIVSFSIDHFKYIALLFYTYGYVLIAGILIRRYADAKISLQYTFKSYYAIILSYLVFMPVLTYILYHQYQSQQLSPYTLYGFMHNFTRYLGLGFLSYIIVRQYRFLSEYAAEKIVYFESILIAVGFVLVNVELNFVYDVFDWSFPVVFPLLWALLALMSLIFGIIVTKKHFRYGGLIIFCLALARLFLIDIWEFSSIAKTIVFILVGIILLLGSFQYQKYRHILFPENKDE